MIIQILLLILGLGMLIKGADWLVEGASSLAKKFNVSDLAIGLTVVAFGTSAPELVVNSFASFHDHHDIVLGNVIGSNNFNLFVILGIAGIITPLVVQSGTVWKEIPFSFFALFLLFFLANDFFSEGSRTITRIDGVILLVMFVTFLYYVFNQLKRDPVKTDIGQKQFTAGKIWFFILAGLAGLVIGGRLAVDNAVKMAITFGMSEKIIGLTIISAGTSLPELATSVVAAIKKNNDIAVGNIIGSNIFNIFLILGVSSLIHPIDFNNQFNTDIYLMSAGTILLFVAMFTGKKKKLDRWEAVVLFLIYTVYIANLIRIEV
jgi:cation:H+ antiporter